MQKHACRAKYCGIFPVLNFIHTMLAVIIASDDLFEDDASSGFKDDISSLETDLTEGTCIMYMFSFVVVLMV